MAIDAATPAPPARTRRDLLAAVLGGLAGLFASRVAGLGSAAEAAGDPLVLGSTTNTAGTSNTTLTTTSAGAALLITQNGSGSAVRGSSKAAGAIAGSFVASNGTGISGVTGDLNRYGVFGSNDDAAVGTGGAVRADGNMNDGIVASTDHVESVAIKATSSALNGTVALLQNTSGGGLTTAGAALRAYTGLGSDDEVHPGGSYADAAGEFAGPSGVIGAATHAAGHGVLGLATFGTGVHGASESGWALVAAGRAKMEGYVDLEEIALPDAPPAKSLRLFVRDDGAGKSQLCVIFPGGELLVIATST